MKHKRAFTLIELLVVMGIIAVLIGLIVPSAARAIHHAQRTRTASDLQMIAAALTAYHQDFKAYPQVNRDGEGPLVLSKALIGPEPATLPPLAAGDPPRGDGQDGPGFRTRKASANGTQQGKVYGPYLNPDHFRTAPEPGYEILDMFGQPILYFPTTRGPFTPAQPAKYIDNWHHPLPSESPNTAPRPYLNSADCFGPTADRQYLPPAVLDAILGLDRAGNAFARQAPSGIDYLLISAGPDDKFGPQDPKHPERFDDVMNIPGGQ